MIKVLFVCHGNICRSPMAEFVMKDLIVRGGWQKEFHIESAATTSEEIWGGVGNPIYAPAQKELARHGIGVPGNELGVSAERARKLVRKDYDRFDYLIGMDEENRYDMKYICGGDPEGKISCLMDYTERRGEVADPWYTRDFRATWNDVTEGCRALLAHLGYTIELPASYNV